MQKEAKTRMWVTILGGWFGLHKFMYGEVGKGFLYLFTAGLLYIGWIIDSVKAYQEYSRLKNAKPEKPLMPKESIDLINQGKLAKLEPDPDLPLTLPSDEKLYFMEKCTTKRSHTYTTGYKRSSRGYSIRITKGISSHVGGGDIKAVRQTSTSVYGGVLFLTNKRIAYVSKDLPFDIPLEKITSVALNDSEGVLIQSGNKSYCVDFKTAPLFVKAYRIVASHLKKK